ncbi:phenylacetate--CoA ligase [Selenomonadales bacterium OttesenSCG-928-I06]|nr:phenylacetate--CoA ligase [Selenomonadales bacterium OttesenSCG-928-I06]
MIWNKYETMDPSKMESLQEERLLKVVKYTYENVPFYNELLKEHKISPQDIKSKADISKLPFITKQNMRERYPHGMLAVPIKKLSRFHTSSGTTGRPTAVAYTAHDLDIWAEVLARSLAAGGLCEESIFQVTVKYGLFTGGLGMQSAAEKIGATIIPSSTGNTARQIMLMKDFGTTHFIATPSYALFLRETMDAEGISIDELNIQSVFCGAEAWSEDMRRELERQYKVKTYDIYGLSEIIGPGVSCDCPEQNGLHIQEDHFYLEVIDPETGEVLPEGEEGELVITTLTKEAMPMIRYRTRDLTRLYRDKCPCGRTTLKMKRVMARSDDMLIIRGVNMFPSQVESVLLGMGILAPHYQLVVDRINNLDILTVRVEMTEELFLESQTRLIKLEAEIKERLKGVLGVKAIVKLVEPQSIERSEGKAKRVIDNRR